MAKYSIIGNEVLFSNRYVSESTQVPANDKCPRIVLLYGPCRSGTTAIFKSFSEVMPISYYQPIKSLMRYGNPTFVIESKPEPVFIKETLGPWRDQECFYNPWQFLIDAGIPAKNISLVPIIREPIRTFDSWKRTFEATDLNRFIDTYAHFLKIHEESIRLGMDVYPIYYEQLQSSAEDTMTSVLEFLDIEYKDSVINWDKKDDKSSNILKIPQSLQMERIGNIASSGGLKYVNGEIEDVKKEEEAQLRELLTPKYELYRDSVLKITQNSKSLLEDNHSKLYPSPSFH